MKIKKTHRQYRKLQCPRNFKLLRTGQCVFLGRMWWHRIHYYHRSYPQNSRFLLVAYLIEGDRDVNRVVSELCHVCLVAKKFEDKFVVVVFVC